jgi:hypothetical protein
MRFARHLSAYLRRSYLDIPETESKSRVDDIIRRILLDHVIQLNKSHWQGFLTIFRDEDHTLYPFLHSPTLRSGIELLSDACSLEALSISRRPLDRLSAVQILLCLAIRKYTPSPGVDRDNRSDSAGWSLYTADMKLIGGMFECKWPRSTAGLQSLALAV